jgi:thymidine phosphorylase
VLAGGGPADIRELTLVLAREMLDLAGLSDVDPAAALDDGRAMDVWRRMITAQGGDPAAELPRALHRETVRATSAGVVTNLSALPIGVAAWRLGAGRARKEESVSAGAGIEILVEVGAEVRVGAPLLELHTDDLDRLPAALAELADAISIGRAADVVHQQLVLDRIGA